MAKDIGEEIVGAWLREIAECDFVQYNVPTIKQGEIDVVGLRFQGKVVYICEVATHLDGLLYVNPKDNQTNNEAKLTQKFDNIIEFAKRYSDAGYACRFMFWSPIVKIPLKQDAKDNAFRDLARLKAQIFRNHSINIEIFINEIYRDEIHKLIAKAKADTRASESPAFRLLQILERLDKHVGTLKIGSQAKLEEELIKLQNDKLE